MHTGLSRFSLRPLALGGLLLLTVASGARPSWTRPLGNSPPSDAGYSVSELDTEPAGDATAALSLNDSGDVTGYADTADGARAYFWPRAGSPRDLGVLPGDSHSYGQGINASGTICGTSQGTSSHAFVWTDTGGIRALAPLATGTDTWAYGINAGGQVAGSSNYVASDGTLCFGAVVWSASGQVQRIPSLGDLPGVATAIDDAGQVTGYHGVVEQRIIRTQPFLWDAATGVRLMNQAGGQDERPVRINPAERPGYTAAAANKKGQSAGTRSHRDGRQARAYLMSPTTAGETASSVSAQTPVNLGTASRFVLLTKTGITTTGATRITGDIGTSPIASTALTGFGLVMDGSRQFSRSSLVLGRVYAANYASPTPAMLTKAVSDMQLAYNNAAGRLNPTAKELGAGNIGGKTIKPGLYKWSTNVVIPSDVTLTGPSTAVWIFQIAGTLNISSGKRVVLSGGALSKNIYWQVAGQTTLGTTSVFNGNILDKTAVVIKNGAKLNGRALAQTAVTLDANTIRIP